MGVYVKVPLGWIAGCALKIALLVFVTMKSNACVDSSATPALIPVAQPATVCAPPLSKAA
jgi:hypothetical protein